MSVGQVLSSEVGITLVGGLVGGVWSLIKSSQWFARRRRARYMKAVQALEAGVEQTYREYVRALKDAHEDGRLTREEAHRARRLAQDAAVRFGRREGVDVVRELGEDYVEMWLTRLVNRLKR